MRIKPSLRNATQDLSGHMLICGVVLAMAFMASSTVWAFQSWIVPGPTNLCVSLEELSTRNPAFTNPEDAAGTRSGLTACLGALLGRFFLGWHRRGLLRGSLLRWCRQIPALCISGYKTVFEGS